MCTIYKSDYYLSKKMSYFEGYAVDSETVSGLTYLSDGKLHGLIRAKEAMTWPKSEDAEIIGKMVPEVRAEATEVFEMARRWERCSAN